MYKTNSNFYFIYELDFRFNFVIQIGHNLCVNYIFIISLPFKVFIPAKSVFASWEKRRRQSGSEIYFRDLCPSLCIHAELRAVNKSKSNLAQLFKFYYKFKFRTDEWSDKSYCSLMKTRLMNVSLTSPPASEVEDESYFFAGQSNK